MIDKAKADRLAMLRVKKRILACLKGIATATPSASRPRDCRRGVVRWYPEEVRGFEGPPGTVFRCGNFQAGEAARVTDDHDGCGPPSASLLETRQSDARRPALLAARFPDTVNEQAQAVVEAVNEHRLTTLADDLAELRR